MNLIDDEVNNQKEKNIKAIKIIGGALIFLIILVIILITYLGYLKSKKLKFTLDGNNQEITSDLFYYDDSGYLYISIKDLCNILKLNSIKAEYNNGEYKKYNESLSECNIKQENEISGYTQDSNTIYKVSMEDGSYEYFNIDKQVKNINNKLYTTKQGILIGFNITVTENKNTNSISMYTLDQLVNYYADSIKGTVVKPQEMSFENKKAVKYDMIITQNANNEFGVQRISTGDMVLGNKYSALKFMEGTQDFIVTTPEKKQGIISTTGGKTIDPKLQFSEIKQIKNDLYLVKNDKGKYGVYNREKQKNIIYPEYDVIGVDPDQFTSDDIKNNYILYDYCIPCCKKGDQGVNKWTIININGEKLVNQTFDSIGYIKGTSDGVKYNNLLLIPEIEGIIVNKSSKYGVISSLGKILVPIATEQIYAEAAGGENTYYMVYNNNTYNLIEELKKANIKIEKRSDEEKTSNEDSNATTSTDKNNE